MISNQLIVQIVMIVLLVGVIVTIFLINRAYNIEKRYKRYSLEPLNNKELPLSDRLSNFYRKLKKRISRSISKSKALKDYSKKYEKYLNRTKRIREKPIDFVSTKFIWGFIAIIFIIVVDVFKYTPVTLYQLALFFLIGFFIPDIYWKYKNKLRQKQIEKDMLKAIIIMNNSFKSGLSIMQAIKMVSNELDGPISEEFRKMYMDISFGLDMDLVFERFSKRVNTEEAAYIRTSLSVLNKTGGNIVEVFSSVEASAFTRKKLKEELKALSSSANAIYKILLAVPVFLVLIIYVLNPSYFAPLFKTTTGLFILMTMLVMYVTYILVIRRIIKVGDNV